MNREYVIDALNDIKDAFISTIDDEGGVIFAEEKVKTLEDELALTQNKRDIILALREIIGCDFILSAACVALSDGKLASIALDTVKEDKFWKGTYEPDMFFDLVYYALEHMAKYEVYPTNSLKETCAIICAFALYVTDKISVDKVTKISVTDIITHEVDSKVTKTEIRDFFNDGTFIDTNEYVCDGGDYNTTYNNPPLEFHSLMEYAGVLSSNEFIDKFYKSVAHQIKNAMNFVKRSQSENYNHNNMAHRAKMLKFVQDNMILKVMKDFNIPNNLINAEYAIFRPAIDVAIRDILMNSVCNLTIIYKLSAQSIVRHLAEIKGGLINERLICKIDGGSNNG